MQELEEYNDQIYCLKLTTDTVMAALPNVEKLLTNTFYDSVPMLPLSASFPNLCMLVLDGESDLYSFPRTYRVISQLHATVGVIMD